MGIPGRVNGRDGNGKVVFRIDFTYRISWIGIVGGTIPGTENRIPSILVGMQWKIAESSM